MRICQCEACGFCTDLSQAYGGYPCLPRQLSCSQRLVQGKPGDKRTRLVISALLYYFMHLELRGTANTGNLIRKKRPSIDTGRFPGSTYGNPSAFLSLGGTPSFLPRGELPDALRYRSRCVLKRKEGLWLSWAYFIFLKFLFHTSWSLD